MACSSLQSPSLCLHDTKGTLPPSKHLIKATAQHQVSCLCQCHIRYGEVVQSSRCAVQCLFVCLRRRLSWTQMRSKCLEGPKASMTSIVIQDKIGMLCKLVIFRKRLWLYLMWIWLHPQPLTQVVGQAITICSLSSVLDWCFKSFVIFIWADWKGIFHLMVDSELQ